MASMDALQVLKRPVEEKYRRFTGRRCAPNTAKAIEIAKEKARAPKRRGTGRKNRNNRGMNSTIAPVSGGRLPGFLFPPSQRPQACSNEFASFAVILRLKNKPRPKRWRPDARMSLCTC